MEPEIAGALERIARLCERELRTQSHLHLAPCGGCAAPAFQQPCSLCGYYPYGSDRGTWSPHTATRERFEAAVEASGPGRRGGNLATWVASAYARRVPYAKDERYTLAVDRLAGEAAAMTDLPSAGAVWDVVVEKARTVSREPRSYAVQELWACTFELTTRCPGPESTAVADRAVAAAHSDDPEQVATALHEITEAAKQAFQATGRRDGNLAWAWRRAASATAWLEVLQDARQAAERGERACIESDACVLTARRDPDGAFEIDGERVRIDVRAPAGERPLDPREASRALPLGATPASVPAPGL